MASGAPKHTVFALWNSVDDSNSQHDAENQGQKNLLPVHPSQRGYSRKPRGVHATVHTPQSKKASDTNQYEFHQQKEQSKETKQSRSQRQHRSHSSSVVRHPGNTSSAICEVQQDHSRNVPAPRNSHNRYIQHSGKQNVEPRKTFNQTKSLPASRRSSSCSQVNDHTEDTLNRGPQKSAPSQMVPKQMHKRKEYSISYSRLQTLVTKCPDEILLTLVNPQSGFFKLIELPDISPEMMSLVLTALGKACESKLRENLLALVNSVTSNHIFMFYSLQMFLVSLQMNPTDTSLDLLQYFVEFLKTFADSQPATASQAMAVLSPLLLKTVEKCGERNHSLRDHLSELLNDLTRQTELFVEQHTVAEIKKATAEEKLQLQKPPENFREIPILPEERDIYDYQPFLRPNVVEGKYLDVDHYLDVQFRLLREDFVRPLREGIAEYKMLGNKEQARKCKDLRVYLNVHVVGSEFVHGTLIHLLQFDVEKFKNVSWEYSKRFLTGSLLGLSADNFKTMLFATVIRRDIQKLKKGLLMIKFEELTDVVQSITPFVDFVILETEAYFEAYRHILVALQNITELPLKRYVVDVEKNIDSPQYLSKYTTYDISPLLLPIDVSKLDACDIESRKLEFRRNPDCDLKALPILNDSLWPTENELGLDASQFKALKAALTKEFSVIQGPPGTGKTYIGLRIVQLLLHNASKWNTSNAPILVVCYTNHALDQFLEGILNFTQKLVRIGGRCNSDQVEPYHLNNLRSKIRMERDVPKHIFSSIKEKNMVLNSLQREVNETESTIQKGSKTILSEEILKSHIKSTHYAALKRQIVQLADNPLNLPDDGHIIYDWLEIRFRGFELENYEEIDVPNSGLNSGSGFNSTTNRLEGSNESQDVGNEMGPDDDDFGSEGEGDVDFMEAMREVDDEELTAVDIDLYEGTEEEDLVVLSKGMWQTQGGAKKRKKYIQRMLRSADVMNPTEADRVVDIWRLNVPDRWRLYRYWLKCYISDKQESIMETQQKVRQEYKQLCEMKLAEDLHVLKGLEVVGMTTTGAAKYRTILQVLDPRIVIVEEAAEILESHIVTSLSPSTQHLILIGDHQQLRPSPTVYQLATKYHLDISLFERMIKNGLESYVLSIQHRMRPSIAALLVPHIYAELKNDESVLKYESIKGISSNIFFLNHSYCEGKESDSASKVNNHEASFLVEFCRYLLLQGYSASQITILTAYSGQLMLLKKLTKKPLYRGVRITVIDNFQGEENDIILISFVRSNDDGVIGFLKTANRVCVALSRAKKGLYCIGNFMLLAEKSKLWQDMMTTLETESAVGDAIELSCQNHPNCFSFVTTAKDFKSVPEGGCTRPCEYRLQCGHTCTRMCHPYDPLHEKFQCQKPCSKIVCESGHKCQKQCHQECGECSVRTLKTIPLCKHEVLVPCFLNPGNFKCTFRCNKKLLCGHLCTKTCGERCIVDCQERIMVSSPCGHTVSVLCYKADSVLYVVNACLQKCNTELDCGHLCEGTCSTCCQGRLHMPCKSPCQRILVCGHQCVSECAQSCPPCKKDCENRCFHSKCPQKCGVPCNPCREKCQWKCIHKKCTKLCWEPCDRSPCDEPCQLLLPCKHVCVGLCGEPCPKQCAVCDGQQLKEVFFGSEDEEDARFIRLEDCNHVFEVDGLTRWMELDSGKAGEIQMKYCPKCKTVIRRNLRFNNIIKSRLRDVEKVKLVVFGEKQQISRRKKGLLEHLNTDLSLSDTLMKSLTNILSKRNLSMWDVERCENIFNLATAVTEIYSNIRIDFSHLGIKKLKQHLYNNVKGCQLDYVAIIDCLCETEALIQRFLHREHGNATLQQLKEIACELQRLKLSSKLWNILNANSSRAESSRAFCDAISRSVTHLNSIRFARFTETEEEKLNKNIETLTKLCGGAVLGITDIEKKLIVHAMNLRVGHWYQCPNGHVYCITECGGAVVTGKCSECGASIGGQHHTLRSDNRVATAMDGARRDAWTLAANAENYDLNDLV